MNNKIMKLSIGCFFTFLLLTSSTSMIPADQTQSHYHDIYNYSLSTLQKKVDNTTLLNNTYYHDALDQNMQYPMHSHKLLSDCQQIIISQQLIPEDEIENKSIYQKIDELEKQIAHITVLIEDYQLHSLPALEWYSLSEYKLDQAKENLNEASQYYDVYDYENCIYHLSNAYALFQQSTQLLFMSNQTNDGTFDHNRILNICKNLSIKWIERADTSFEYLNSFGTTTAIQNCRSILNTSKELKTQERYYMALMKAAYANAFAEYLMNHPIFSNRQDGIQISRTYLNKSKLSLFMVYNNNDIDAPLAQYKIEQSSLHINDAIDSETETVSLALLGISMKESLIAEEQAKAALSLHMESEIPATISNQIIDNNYDNLRNNNQNTESNTIAIITTGFIIVILLNNVVIFYYFYIRKSNKIKKK